MEKNVEGAVGVQSEVLYWHLSWKTEKNHGYPYPGRLVFGLKFEPGTYQIHSKQLPTQPWYSVCTMPQNSN